MAGVGIGTWPIRRLDNDVVVVVVMTVIPRVVETRAVIDSGG
jgi:hypothetical protein